MESQSTDADQKRMLEAMIAAHNEFLKIISSARSPASLHKEESDKQRRSFLDKVEAIKQRPDEDNDAELEKLIDIGVQWKHYNEQHSKDALAREHAQYLKDMIHRCREPYEKGFSFWDSLIQPVSEPEARHQHPTPPQDSAQNEQPPPLETQNQSEIHHEAEPLETEPDPCPPTPGPSQSPVTSKRRFVTALDQPPTPRLGSTIDFQEIYQGGNGTTRYTIVDQQHTLSSNPSVSGQWWILRCAQCNNWHGATIRKRTLHEGGKHATKCHPQFRWTGDASTLDALGVLVLNCDQVLFMKNNEEVKNALIDGSYEPQHRQNKNKRRKIVRVEIPQRKSNEPPIMTDPKVGILHLAHRRDGAVFAAVVLPLGDFHSRVGIRGSIYDPGPFKALPDCYRFHEGQRKFFWAEGYEDGGGNVTMRQFPVFYLDGPSVAMGHMRWASADDLEPFDITKVTPGYDKPVEEYTKYYQLNNGIKSFSCELSKEEWLVSSGHGPDSRAVSGGKGSNPQTQPTSVAPIVVEDDEVLNDGPCTSIPEGEQIPLASNSESRTPVPPRNPEPETQVDGAANGSDATALSTSNPERIPSPHFYIPPDMDLDEEIVQPEQPVLSGEKAPEAVMNLGSYASPTASPVANRAAAATMQVIKSEHGQGENVDSLPFSFPLPTGSGPAVQGHDYDPGLSHYRFAVESPRSSELPPDISNIHGL
ncbi:unnamed protein product [Clonostachys rosea]|uniref:Uncharacterized protein n=1 Tax=Bionectria ochroleuca TaxID=29856 RepID=A0ABY6TUN8_BIOOC|nr:unnamed protein product [Clonostachys rosea]